ncbi:MAG: hypothetical protein HN366_08065 [Deltaproteobacteria bacterium]|jgi:hypothetical protein|nr:hypothetical protein [Deltaproteobacteria bacterium]
MKTMEIEKPLQSIGYMIIVTKIKNPILMINGILTDEFEVGKDHERHSYFQNIYFELMSLTC